MDIWSLLIILGIAQGLFTLSVLLIKGKASEVSYLYLIFIVLFFIWLQAEFLSIRNVFNLKVNIFYGTRHGSWFLLGPLFLFYLKGATRDAWKPTRKDLLHFMPFIVFTVVIPLLFTDFLGFRQVHYGMLTVFDSWKEVITPFQYLYSIIFITQFLHLGTYIYLAFALLHQYVKDLKDDHSTIESEQLRWLKIFNYGIVSILIVSSLFLCIFFFTEIYRRHLDYIYVLPMGILTYLIGYQLAGVKFKKISTRPASKSEVQEKYGKSSLKEEQAELYIDAVEKYFLEGKPYTNNELRLQDLSKALNIPSHHLSQVLNQNLNTSFFDFINRHRIDEAKRLMKVYSDSTLLQIAYGAGFNNKTSFVNAFKKFEGVTPSMYLRANRAEVG